MTFEPKFLATGIGSVPFVDVDRAVNVPYRSLPEAPFWPQMPKSGLTEQMEIQYSEGVPRAVIDKEKERMYIDTSGDYSEEFAAFYESYMVAMDPDEGTGDCSALAISPEYSKGIYALESKLKNEGKKLPFLKVQTTGPCSFSLTIVDENKRSIYYNEEFRDLVVKALAMKSRWQIQKFAPFADKIICFIDEPILSAFGSSTYVSVKREDVIAAINEVVEAIHSDGALAGIHCCGNTEWSIPIEAGADIVNFDAYDYGETISMYPDHVKQLFERGGALAWGIVPTSPEISQVTTEDLAGKLDSVMGKLASTGIDRDLINSKAIITPSCGTGSMSPEEAEKVFEATPAVAAAMKQKTGLSS